MTMTPAGSPAGSNAGSSAGSLRVVVIDDEPLAREGLAAAIGELVATAVVPSMTVVAQAGNGRSGLDAIRDTSPDIVLADIAMPVLDGVAMFEQLEPEATPPAVIFVTAYEEHALRAFGVHALDYLVKPVPTGTLARALLRAVARIAEVRALRTVLATEPVEPLVSALNREGTWLQRLIIPERGVRLVVPVHDIEWIEGETYYVRVHASGRSRLLRERLSALEAALDPNLFFRCHRSAIVRLELVREIRAESAYAFSATLSSGARVPVSRDRRDALEAQLSQRG
jgi:two-component system LytT family response regulator